MSSIVLGYRQLEVNQLEIHKATVARFEWTLHDATLALIARGQSFVFGEGARVTGWEEGKEYWYVSTVGVAAPPERFTIECKELVSEDDAASILSKYSPAQAFVASMVPVPERLVAGDPVLAQAMVHGQFGATTSGASAAALWLELEGQRIKRLDWYWSGTAPLSLFPGGATIGARVELRQVRNGSAGFPQVGWSKCHQEAASAP